MATTPQASAPTRAGETDMEQMSMKALLALHNDIADAPAGPKTFSTKSKLIDRIKAIAEVKNLDLDSSRQPQSLEAATELAQPRAESSEEPKVTKKKSQGKGIGLLAREILMDPAGYPHATVAEMVNTQIEGATATAKSIRWYACDMRKQGIDVPPRKISHPAYLNKKDSIEWLQGLKVISPSSNET